MGRARRSGRGSLGYTYRRDAPPAARPSRARLRGLQPAAREGLGVVPFGDDPAWADHLGGRHLLVRRQRRELRRHSHGHALRARRRSPRTTVPGLRRSDEGHRHPAGREPAEQRPVVGEPERSRAATPGGRAERQRHAHPELTPFKVGVVGTGVVAGYGHLPAIAENPDLELTIVYDPLSAHAERVAAKHGCAWTTDADEFYRRDLDAITIASPLPTHREHVVRALTTGRD
ncbi:hypothetical protein EON77_02720, partial [bacterium]